MTTIHTTSKVSIARKRANSRYRATFAVVLIYLGYDVGPLSLTDPGDAGIPGSSEPVNSPRPPTFFPPDYVPWHMKTQRVSFVAAVRMAEYAGQQAMGKYAPQETAATAGLSHAEQDIVDEIVACREKAIRALTRALFQAGQLDHDRMIAVISSEDAHKSSRWPRGDGHHANT
jgi:hypothetical protein